MEFEFELFRIQEIESFLKAIDASAPKDEQSQDEDCSAPQHEESQIAPHGSQPAHNFAALAGNQLMEKDWRKTDQETIGLKMTVIRIFFETSNFQEG